MKKIRLSRDYTIKDVARRINVSVSLLSQIENGKITPSLQSLEELLKFYAINFSDFFKQVEKKKYIFVAAGEAETMVNVDHSIRLSLLASKLQNNALESFIVEINPGSSLDIARHDEGINGERLILGMSGSVETIFDDKSFTISPGDSVNFKSFVTCKITNTSSEEAKILVTGMPPLVL